MCQCISSFSHSTTSKNVISESAHSLHSQEKRDNATDTDDLVILSDCGDGRRFEKKSTFESSVKTSEESCSKLHSELEELQKKYNEEKLKCERALKNGEAEVEKLVVEHNLEKSALTFEFSHKFDSLKSELEKICLEREEQKLEILELTNTLSVVKGERDTLTEKLDHQRSCGRQRMEQLYEEIESLCEFYHNASQPIMTSTNAHTDIRSRFDNSNRKRDVESKEGELTDVSIQRNRDRLEKYLAEKKDLESRKVVLEEDYHNLALQYAQILGHQNRGHKIQHMVQLREKNIELKEEAENLKTHNRAQKQTIKKKEPTINKENVDQTNLPLDLTLHIPLKNKENGAAIRSARKTAGSSPIRQILKSIENSPVVHRNVKS